MTYSVERLHALPRGFPQSGVWEAQPEKTHERLAGAEVPRTESHRVCSYFMRNNLSNGRISSGV
jgi:hypothetical protein